MPNVIFAITNIERPDNENPQTSVKGGIVDLILKTDSVTGLPTDGTFLPGSRAWHPQTGKVYVLNADHTAWVLCANTAANVPTPAADNHFLYSLNGSWADEYFPDAVHEALQEYAPTESSRGVVLQAANVPASEEDDYPTVEEFNALLAALKASGVMEPDATDDDSDAET